MKFVPDETVDQVIKNNPMPRISRVNDVPDDASEKEKLLKQLLRMLFPGMSDFGSDYSILTVDDSALNAKLKEAKASYRKARLRREQDVMKSEVKRFKETRGALKLMLEDNIVRRDSIIPINYLPDLFMATPVWYFHSGGFLNEYYVFKTWEVNDPMIYSWIWEFCNLFPKSQRWMDTFQMFNYRVRTLDMYKGEVIPPYISQRMNQASKVFDYVVIATPYHDQAGNEWQNLKWERPIDPYVIGFKKGVPFFFILGRFSGTGTFPLFNDLVADTTEFLRANKDKLIGFNGRRRWWTKTDSGITADNKHGDYLKHHTDMLLKAFDQGILFDWLRGEAELAEV